MKKQMANIIAVLLILMFLACSSPPPPPRFTAESIDYEKPDSVICNIYVDATLSMMGFVNDNNPKYNNFIVKTEDICISLFDKKKFEYFQFGDSALSIGRNDFLQVNTDEFYEESSVRMKTYLDALVSNLDSNELHIIFTDLYQDKSDIIKIVQEFDKYEDISIGIVALTAPFKGYIYDIGISGDKLRYDSEETGSERPFYMLVIGEAWSTDNFIHKYAEKFSIDSDNIIFLSPYYTYESIIPSEIELDRDARPIQYKVVMQKNMNAFMIKGESGFINIKFNSKPIKNMPEFSIEDIVVRSNIEGIEVDSIYDDNKIRSMRILFKDIEKNNKFKTINLTTNLTSINIPEFVGKYNMGANIEGDKTYNLKRFISLLIDTYMKKQPILMKMKFNYLRKG